MGLLGHPGAGRVNGAAGHEDATAGQLDEEQYVEALQRDRLHGEEVDGEHALRLRPQKRPPRDARALPGRADASLAQDLLDGRRRHSKAQTVDLASDPLIAPTRVLAGEAKHELADLAADWRTPGPSGVCPAASNETAMPA
jgi:hypothetical protein